MSFEVVLPVLPVEGSSTKGSSSSSSSSSHGIVEVGVIYGTPTHTYVSISI